MYFTGLGTANPPYCYTQLECWEAARGNPKVLQLKPRSRAILQKVFTGKNGILTRHLALNPLDEAFDISPDVLHARFSKHAPILATQAAERALSDAGVSAREIDAVIITTCTGYLCPGLTSYVSERLGLRADVLALDLVGLGCGAALPNLRTAENLLKSGNCAHVLSISVEVCSAAFYLDDDPGVLISACLFGDGAGAAVLSNRPAVGRRRVRWKISSSLLSPADRDQLRFEQKNGMLRNVLSPCVPVIAGKHARSLLDEVLARADVRRDQINGWIFHAGGREVLHALQENLMLQPSDVELSANILREFGNLSSPFVLFVLQAALAASAPGGLWWMCSFGAGFACHGALLEVD